MNIPKDLVAASATPIVLAILKQGENYGYSIIKKVCRVSDDRLNWTDGMLYPVLHRLEDAGFISSTWKKAETGRKRKYYSLTREGEKELDLLTGQWMVVHNALTRLTSEYNLSEKEGSKDV